MLLHCMAFNILRLYCWFAVGWLLCARRLRQRSDPGSATVNFTCFTLSTAYQAKLHGTHNTK